MEVISARVKLIEGKQSSEVIEFLWNAKYQIKFKSWKAEVIFKFKQNWQSFAWFGTSFASTQYMRINVREVMRNTTS